MNKKSNNVIAISTIGAALERRNNIRNPIYLLLLLTYLTLLSTSSVQAERNTMLDISPAGTRIALGYPDSYVEEAVKLAGATADTQQSLIMQRTQQPELVNISHDIYIDLMVSQAQRIARQTAGNRFPEHEVDSMISEIERLIQQFEHQDSKVR